MGSWGPLRPAANSSGMEGGMEIPGPPCSLCPLGPAWCLSFWLEILYGFSSSSTMGPDDPDASPPGRHCRQAFHTESPNTGGHCVAGTDLSPSTVPSSRGLGASISSPVRWREYENQPPRLLPRLQTPVRGRPLEECPQPVWCPARFHSHVQQTG